jgi:hypothetical protein
MAGFQLDGFREQRLGSVKIPDTGIDPGLSEMKLGRPGKPLPALPENAVSFLRIPQGKQQHSLAKDIVRIELRAESGPDVIQRHLRLPQFLIGERQQVMSSGLIGVRLWDILEKLNDPPVTTRLINSVAR